MTPHEHFDDPLRATGRTTKQMQDAPLNARYVWPVGSSLSYAKALALFLERDDLFIINLENWKTHGRDDGRTDPAVIDHACDI